MNDPNTDRADGVESTLYDSAADKPVLIGVLFLVTCFGLGGWAVAYALFRWFSGVAS